MGHPMSMFEPDICKKIKISGVDIIQFAFFRGIAQRFANDEFITHIGTLGH